MALCVHLVVLGIGGGGDRGGVNRRWKTGLWGGVVEELGSATEGEKKHGVV